MKFSIFVILFFCFSSLFGQARNIYAFVDSIEHILKTENLNESKKDSLEKVLSTELFNFILDETLPMEKRRFASKGKLRQIQRFQQYADEKERVRKAISQEVLSLENQLATMQDSISKIQKRLIEIIEADSTNRKSKERATQTLLKIRKPEIIEYAFKNEKKLRFGEVNWDDELDQSHRTSLDGLYQNYALETPGKWALYPYALKYLDYGDFNVGELLFLINFFDNGEVQSPELLYEFMIQNSEEENSKYLKELRKDYYPKFIFEYKK